MTKIFVIGTGNLGKRHIQAIANLNIEFKLYCFDSFESGRNSIFPFLKENKIKIDDITICETEDQYLKLVDADSILIHAATAQNRIDSLAKIIAQKPRAIIIEKPVCQQRDDYNKVLQLQKEYDVDVFVNYIAHMQSFYQRIIAEINPKENFLLQCNMPKWGIACVGIHQLELASWFFDLITYDLIHSELEEVYQQKRAGFYDMAGSISVSCGANRKIILTNSNWLNFASIQLIMADKIYSLHEEQKLLTILDKETNELEKVKLDYRYVSMYTNELIERILNNDTNSNSFIPTIEQSVFSHNIVYEFMEKNNVSDLNIT